MPNTKSIAKRIRFACVSDRVYLENLELTSFLLDFLTAVQRICCLISNSQSKCKFQQLFIVASPCHDSES